MHGSPSLQAARHSLTLSWNLTQAAGIPLSHGCSLRGPGIQYVQLKARKNERLAQVLPKWTVCTE